jgi:hypothetical protein
MIEFVLALFATAVMIVSGTQPVLMPAKPAPVETAAPMHGDFDLDKSWTTRGQENKAGSQVLYHSALTSPGSFQTEREGFEPSDPLIGSHGFSKPAHSTTLPPLLKPYAEATSVDTCSPASCLPSIKLLRVFSEVDLLGPVGNRTDTTSP